LDGVECDSVELKVGDRTSDDAAAFPKHFLAKKEMRFLASGGRDANGMDAVAPTEEEFDDEREFNIRGGKCNEREMNRKRLFHSRR